MLHVPAAASVLAVAGAGTVRLRSPGARPLCTALVPGCTQPFTMVEPAHMHSENVPLLLEGSTSLWHFMTYLHSYPFTHSNKHYEPFNLIPYCCYCSEMKLTRSWNLPFTLTNLLTMAFASFKLLLPRPSAKISPWTLWVSRWSFRFSRWKIHKSVVYFVIFWLGILPSSA